MDTLAKAEYAIFDKTGTLTSGTPAISHIVSAGEHSREDILRYAASAEIASSHPLAKAIVKAWDKDTVPTESIHENAGRGIEATLEGGDVVGVFRPAAEYGKTAVEVFLNGALIGSIHFTDQIKKDAKEAITAIKKLGIKETVILTGDSAEEAERVKSALGIDTAYSRLLPEDKLRKIEELCESGTVIYTGDGINDSPSLARADAGVAMGALGSEAAIEAADVVLMDSSPIRLAEAVKLSKRTHSIVKANIFIALGVKIAVLVLALMGLTGMWSAVLADVGMCIICVTNSMRLLRK